MKIVNNLTKFYNVGWLAVIDLRISIESENAFHGIV